MCLDSWLVAFVGGSQLAWSWVGVIERVSCASGDNLVHARTYLAGGMARALRISMGV